MPESGDRFRWNRRSTCSSAAPNSSEACRKQLTDAETRVEILMRRAGEIQAQPFGSDK